MSRQVLPRRNGMPGNPGSASRAQQARMVPGVPLGSGIDLGPGGGHDGGRIVFEGTPVDLVAARSTLTGASRHSYPAPRGAGNVTR